MFSQPLAPVPKLLFRSLVMSVTSMAASVQGVLWLLTTHPSQRNDLLSEHDLLLGADTKSFHCQFLSSCDQDKILYVWDPRHTPGMPQKWQVMLFCVFPGRSSFGFQQLSFCLSHLQYSIRYWASALLQHEHIFCMSNFMGRCCDSSLPAKPPAEAYWRNIVLPSNRWHCNIGLLIEMAFGSGQS